MAIPESKNTPPSLVLDIRYPELPALPSLDAADSRKLYQWYYDLRLVLNRNNATLIAAIDKKADKT